MIRATFGIEKIIPRSMQDPSEYSTQYLFNY